MGWLDKYQNGGTMWDERRKTTPSFLDNFKESEYVPAPTGVTDDLLLRQAYKESTFNHKVKNNKGFMGLAQVGKPVISDYKKAKGLDSFDPYDIEQANAIQKWYMNDLYNASFIDKPNQREDVRLAKTLASYNWGRGDMKNYLTRQKEKGVDIYNSMDWLKELPTETNDYVKKVLLEENEKFNREYDSVVKLPKYKKIVETYKKQNGGWMEKYQDGGDLWKTDKTAYIDSTFAANKDKRWVQRLYENSPGIQLPWEKEGWKSTHYMESGDSTMYPTVIENKSGELEFNREEGRKQGIKFPNDSIAEWMGKNYKQGTNVLNKKYQDGGFVKAQEGDNVYYGTPEYTKAYNDGTFADVPNQLDEVVINSSVNYKRYPLYDKLTEEEKSYFNDKGPIGRGVRRKARTDKGLAEDVKAIPGQLLMGAGEASQMPQSLMVEGIQAARGKEHNFSEALPGGNQRYPDEFIGFENPEGFWENAVNFGINTVTDPVDLFGAGWVADIPKLIRKASKTTLKTKPLFIQPESRYSLGPDSGANWAGYQKYLDELEQNKLINKTFDNIKDDLNDPETLRRLDKLGIDVNSDAFKNRINNLNIKHERGDRSFWRDSENLINIDPTQLGEGVYHQFDDALNMVVSTKNTNNFTPNEVGFHEVGHLMQSEDLLKTPYSRKIPKDISTLMHYAKRDAGNGALKEETEKMFERFYDYSSRETIPTKIDDMLSKLEFEENLNPLAEKSKNYFVNANNQYGTAIDNSIERFPMFREWRQGMRDAGIIGKWDEITPEAIIAFRKLKPNNRLNSSMKFNGSNFSLLKNVGKIAPVLGTGIGIGSLMKTEFKNGGWLDSYEQGGIIEDDRGYWNPANKNKEKLRINSNRISMNPEPGTGNSIDHPILGISDTGDTQLMHPGGEYTFKGNNVTEYPLKAQNGVMFGTPEYKEAYEDETLANVNSSGDYEMLQPLDEVVIGVTNKFPSYKEKVKNTNTIERNFAREDNTNIKFNYDLLKTKPEGDAQLNENWLEAYNIDKEIVNREYKYDGIDYGGNARKFQEEQNEDKTVDLYFKKYSKETKTEVENIQKDLISKGYDPKGIDGKFGSNTKKAYEEMLADNNLDKNTIDKYYMKYSDKENYKDGDKVRAIQTNLFNKGLLAKSGIDGKFGTKTRDAILKYNLNNPEQGEIFSSKSIKEIKKLDTDWCAKGMADILEDQGINTNSVGVRGVDAWHMNNKMADKEGYQSVYNIYEEYSAEFKGVKTGEDLVKATDKVKRKSQTSANMYKKGDIVGLYWRGSEHQNDEAVLKSKTKNTHVGFVSDIIDGVPIITHNVGSTVHHDPYTKLQTAWISRNTNMISAPSRGEVAEGEYNSFEFISNFENQIERNLTEEENKTVQTIYNRASYNAESLPQELGSSVDPTWLKEATLGVIRLESTLGIYANYERKDMLKPGKGVKSNLRYFTHEVKGTKDKDISYGVGKAKVSHLDSFAKKYFGVTDVKDLKDVNKGTDLVTYRLIKNYDKFKDYSKKFPELGLTEEDIRNMAILSYNQGTSVLLQTGRVEDARIFKEELEALRSLYSGNVRDISSTNWAYLEKLGLVGLANKLYDSKNPEGHETYISRVNRMSSELLPDDQLAMQKSSKKIDYNKNGGWLEKYNK